MKLILTVRVRQKNIAVHTGTQQLGEKDVHKKYITFLSERK